MTKPGRGRVGYVGEPSEGVEQRIAEDGEIQVKTPGMMMGYFKNEEATKETITEDGWLRTGDKGELDELGRLKITGRTKEIFKTSKGKYVAPAPIENQYDIKNIRHRPKPETIFTFNGTNLAVITMKVANPTLIKIKTTGVGAKSAEPSWIDPPRNPRNACGESIENE